MSDFKRSKQLFCIFSISQNACIFFCHPFVLCVNFLENRKEYLHLCVQVGSPNIKDVNNKKILPFIMNFM